MMPRGKYGKEQTIPAQPWRSRVRVRLGYGTITDDGHEQSPEIAPSAKFTLQDEARTTFRNHRENGEKTNKLRCHPVRFVRSGLAEPPKHLEHPTEESTYEHDPALDFINSSNAPHHHTYTDTGGDMSAVGAKDSKRLGESSDSDEEVLLFQGRRQMMVERCNPMLDSGSDIEHTETSTEDGGAKTTRPDEDDMGDEVNSTVTVEDCIDLSARKVGGDALDGGSSASNDAGGEADSDDEAIQDYISNIREAGEVGRYVGIGHLYPSLDEDEEDCLGGGLNTWPGDILDGLDMCLTTPATRKARRSKRQMQFEDQEFKILISTALKNPRQKKVQKKRERQWARSQGQHCKVVDPSDLSTKYHAGMSVDQITQEIQIFLAGGEDSVILPPMNPAHRKMVHELAHKFNLTSKSVGKGATRRPTLVKTRGTIRATSPEFNQVAYRVFRHHIAHPELRQSRWGISQTTQHRAAHGANVVMEGQIVGASLPELSSANRGRAMLEKMGWSSGTPLGADENKGILQPVAQIIKRGKSGLGINEGTTKRPR